MANSWNADENISHKKYLHIQGGPKKGDSKVERLSDDKWPPDFNPLTCIFSEFITENKNTVIEYTSTVV